MVKKFFFFHLIRISQCRFEWDHVPASEGWVTDVMVIWLSELGHCCSFGSSGGECRADDWLPGDSGLVWASSSVWLSTSPCWLWEKDTKDCMALLKLSWCLTSWRTHLDRPRMSMWKESVTITTSMALYFHDLFTVWSSTCINFHAVGVFSSILTTIVQSIVEVFM